MIAFEDNYLFTTRLGCFLNQNICMADCYLHKNYLQSIAVRQGCQDVNINVLFLEYMLICK